MDRRSPGVMAKSPRAAAVRAGGTARIPRAAETPNRALPGARRAQPAVQGSGMRSDATQGPRAALARPYLRSGARTGDSGHSALSARRAARASVCDSQAPAAEARKPRPCARATGRKQLSPVAGHRLDGSVNRDKHTVSVNFEHHLSRPIQGRLGVRHDTCIGKHKYRDHPRRRE